MKRWILILVIGLGCVGAVSMVLVTSHYSRVVVAPVEQPVPPVPERQERLADTEVTLPGRLLSLPGAAR